ncbi:1464_t:CDS:1 [Racocetra fulgida]|uniref:1464_t:CDS:1 n=1 Tax=Racocetra fulgida TaxID=60492 RepID=A0A9N8Z5B2_9GLOM|nr:1464_t:CDS:1 [Racocetra fulgida]
MLSDMLSEPNPLLSGISLIGHAGHDGKSRRNWIKRAMDEAKNYINSINYEEFENSRSLTTGSSSIIQKAFWTTKNRAVVLKQILPEVSRIEESEHEELVKEVKIGLLSLHFFKRTLTLDICIKYV